MNPSSPKTLDHGTIDRRIALAALIPEHKRCLLVAGLAGSARDVAALTDDGDHLFALGGVMGAASMIGLGMALGAPEREVVVVTGDGELLMNVGSLVTIAAAAPGNLSIVCLDNARHGETGNQPGHTAKYASLERIAIGAGLPGAMTIATEAELPLGAEFLRETAGPKVLIVRVLPGEPTAYKRLMDPAACRLRFRNAYTKRYIA